MARKTMVDIQHYVDSYNYNKLDSQPYVAVRREYDGYTIYFIDENGDLLDDFGCNFRAGEAYQIVRAMAYTFYYHLKRR